MSLTGIRALGGVVGLLALLAVAWLVRDRFHQKELADGARRCVVAAASETAPLTDCDPIIAMEIQGGRRSRACEQALWPALRPETRFAMAQACESGVKRLVAAHDAAEARSQGLKVQLQAARSDLNSAVERAERRTVRSTEREANGRKVIEAAPRDPGGSIRCDADCLRRLGQ